MILAGVPLRWADAADATVTVIAVNPTHELRDPTTGFLDIGKTLTVKLQAVLGRAELRLDKGLVVIDPRTRVGALDVAARVRPTRGLTRKIATSQSLSSTR